MNLEIVGRFVKGAFTNDLAMIFTVVLFFYFLVALLYQYGRVSDGLVGSLAKTAVNGLPTIGVLGTFVGIALGLLDFNAADIDSSVPNLLEGLKVAFFSSIVGIFLSVILRIVQNLKGAATEVRGASADDICTVLSMIRDENAAIRYAIGGDSDNTMVTQLKNLRVDFRDFAARMAENNTNAVIKALEQVMHDFNTKINEQFGENFKELNAAVVNMVEWQDRYREHVEQLTERLRSSIETIQAVETSLGEVATHTSAIPKHMEELTEVVKALDYETQQIESLLQGFGKLADDAKLAFPTIHENLTNLTQRLSATIETNTGTLTSALTRQQEEIGRQLDDVTRSTQRIRESYEHTFASTSTALSRQIGKLDEEMQEETRRAIELMGQHLGALSEKMAEEFERLASTLSAAMAVTSTYGEFVTGGSRGK